ncbi:MAG: sporulation protein YtfJ [Clostridia bacterium]|nr:sporulation protein YtfJ [Clostridia bacterium]MBQ2939236.1 sporulation protein YtfJ [Clostridia bacterium]
MAKEVQELLGISMEKLREMVSADTVVGSPLVIDGVTLIPVSRITCGLVGGGADQLTANATFAGGSGAGINVVPLAFIVVRDGQVTVQPIKSHPDVLDSAISMIPGTVDKLVGMINNIAARDRGNEQ